MAGIIYLDDDRAFNRVPIFGKIHIAGDALKFLDYEVISKTGETLGRGLARTLNVSETGLRLETSQFFEPEQLLRITLGLDNDLIQVNGRVVNSQPETRAGVNQVSATLFITSRN